MRETGGQAREMDSRNSRRERRRAQERRSDERETGREATLGHEGS